MGVAGGDETTPLLLPQEDDVRSDSRTERERGRSVSSAFSALACTSVAKPLDNYYTSSVIRIFLFPALGGFLYGYDIGGTSALVSLLQSSIYSGVSWHNAVADSSVLQGSITSSSILGAIFGSLLCFKFERALGRRGELLLAAVLYLVGAIVQAISGTSGWPGGLAIATLLIGRVVYGVGAGFAMHGAPAYIGEMSPPSIRGMLVGLKEALIVLGILVGYTVGYLNEETVGGWRSIPLFAIGPAVVLFIGMFLMPSSSRWLVLKGRIEEARKSILFVFPLDADMILTDIQQAVSRFGDAHVTLSALWRPTSKHAMIAGVGLVILQQITGQPSVLYYADTIFTDAGLSSLASVLTGTFKLLLTLVTVSVVDRHGRKVLLFLGITLMLGALLVLAVAFAFPYVSQDDCEQNFDETSCVDYSSQCQFASGCVCSSSSAVCECCSIDPGINVQEGFILAAMFVYIGGYQVGFGPLGWLIISEIFPLELRGKAISVAVVANFSSNLLVTFLFPVEIDFIGASATFFIFAVITVYALYFVSTRLPETKGLSLEEIERMFQAIGGGTRSQ